MADVFARMIDAHRDAAFYALSGVAISCALGDVGVRPERDHEDDHRLAQAISKETEVVGPVGLEPTVLTRFERAASAILLRA